MEEGGDVDTDVDTLVVSRVLESGPRDVVYPMFCQMNRLTDTGSDVAWVEVARWVKFEEVVDEDASRWSKPHVPTLSLHALTCFKRELRHCPLLLDPDVTDFSSIVDKLTGAWLQQGHLDRALEAGIKLALHRPVRKVHELPRAVSTSSNLLLSRDRALSGSSVSLHSLESCTSVRVEWTSHNSADDLSDRGSHIGTPKVRQKNSKMQRKVPKNAVVTNILVGELSRLRRSLMALVRLKPTRHLGWLCEVRLPTQFLFVCLVPADKPVCDVTEIGRCVGTLMIDPIFREVAERSSTRFELLAGVREFTRHATVLPSCVWDPATRLEPPIKVPPQDFRRVNPKTIEERTIPAKEHPDTEDLKRTGRLFGGLLNDIRRKLPWYWSDFKDCLHVQCLASTVFLFLATLTPNVTFGGLLGQETDQFMGTMECILAAAITGVVYALLAGQPMNILGSTGPMLVLEMIIFNFCRDNEWDFLPFRVWIGLWTTLLLLIIVAFDLSALVRYITRFTEECFACLIAIIFIYQAVAKVIEINDTHPVYLGSSSDLAVCFSSATAALIHPAGQEDHNNQNMTGLLQANLTTLSTNSLRGQLSNRSEAHRWCHGYVGDVFFLSFLEFLFTFIIAYALVMFRNSAFFPTMVRQTVSDFAVLIAIIVVVGVDIALKIDTPKLTVPDKFSPTRPDRPWLINPISPHNPWWLALAAAIPAFLATILVFMDQQITAAIVNRKEHKLKKGGGYHLDLLVLAVLIAINSFLGLPWYVAATVSALAHIMSLKVESDCTAPGEKPEFLGVREQRVTALLVGLLSGLSILLTGILKFIPLPVLYGVFMFMGIRALDGMQLVDRCLLYIISPKYQPDYPYLRHVGLIRVHLYTFIQIMCLVMLWLIKTFNETSIGFPIMVVATCFVRKALDCIFTQQELGWLDHKLPPLCSCRGKHKMSSYSIKDHQHINHGLSVPEISVENLQGMTESSAQNTNVIPLQQIDNLIPLQQKENIIPLQQTDIIIPLQQKDILIPLQKTDNGQLNGDR